MHTYNMHVRTAKTGQERLKTRFPKLHKLTYICVVAGYGAKIKLWINYTTDKNYSRVFYPSITML